MTSLKKRVAFFHLDLGIGGAERLVVHEAEGLRDAGYNVHIYTTYRNVNRCFPCTIDGTLNVIVYGSWIPRTIAGRFQVLLSALRMLYLVICVALFQSCRFDVIFIDGVSIINPLLRLMTNKLVFYSHFPDLLLVRNRSTIFRRIYRYFFDWLECCTIPICDVLFVNSKFTRQVVRQTFPRLGAKEIIVNYPPIEPLNVHVTKENEMGTVRSIVDEALDENIKDFVNEWRMIENQLEPALSGFMTKDLNFQQFRNSHDSKSEFPFRAVPPLYFALHRYERKKNVRLAIDAFASVLQNYSKLDPKRPKLIIAGGYDERVSENVDHLNELKDIASQHRNIRNKDIRFLTSISDNLVERLLRLSTCVIFTAEYEHFGIVPCEAMLHGTLVISTNTGGPKETIMDGTTGFLLPATIEDFCSALKRINKMRVDNPEMLNRMRLEAKRHVKTHFSRDAHIETIEKHLGKF